MSIEAIVLAAGLSSRAPSYKMALEFNNKTVLQTCIENMYNEVDKIIVVGGYNFHIIKNLLKNYNKVNLVSNDRYEDGMFSSVRLGINSISSDRFFLIPGDYVLVGSSIYNSLINYESKKSIVIPSYEGIKGHPVFFKNDCIKSLINRSEFNNLREVISHIGFETLDLKDESILYDIDTYEDYKFVKEKYFFKYGSRA
ncbi:nucleotidyltransferase family protein [Clostridium sp.]|uniref:nucleotidyltransferase family protein n=1 Tax=Clostridium sp. TaxID=1506 RepID=UPI002FC9EC8D